MRTKKNKKPITVYANQGETFQQVYDRANAVQKASKSKVIVFAGPSSPENGKETGRKKPPMDRIWAMPNKETFSKIKPIKDLLQRYVPKNQNNNWVNPFSGKSLLCEHNNDINPDINNNPMDAAVYVRKLGNRKFAGFLFDPPFSLNQATTLYNKFHKEKGKGLFCVKPSSMVYWSKIKNNMADRIEKGGICISFGWNSMGLGLNRGFEIVEILLVPHGGSRNDTIVVVERKVRARFTKKQTKKKK